MVARERLICAADDLADGGRGVRFSVRRGARDCPAFAVRHAGQVRAYLNRCAHVPVELDWQPGIFFDFSGSFLICAVHGALYDPRDGRCAGGRCRGAGGLVPVAVIERAGAIYCLEEDDEHG